MIISLFISIKLNKRNLFLINSLFNFSIALIYLSYDLFLMRNKLFKKNSNLNQQNEQLSNKYSFFFNINLILFLFKNQIQQKNLYYNLFIIILY